MMRREPPVRQPMKTRAGVRPYKVSTISGMGNTSPSEAFPSGNTEVSQEDSQAPADFASNLAGEAGGEFSKEAYAPPKGKAMRERVEVFATDPEGRIPGGLYPDRSFGTYGGGIDPGEAPEIAASREFEEEAGQKVEGLRAAKAEPYASPWVEAPADNPVARAKWERRSQQFPGGHRTQYYLGRLGARTQQKEESPTPQLKDFKFRPIPEAISIQEQALKNVTPGGDDERRLRSRLEVLRELQALRKEGSSASNRQDWEDRQIRAQVAEPKKPKTRRVDMTDIDVPEPEKPKDKFWNIPLQERMQLLTENERRRLVDKLAARRNTPVGTVESVQTAPGEFAPGIRGDRGIMSIPKVAPKGKNPEWTAALSMHPADRRGDHHDLRLVDPRGRAHSWAFTDVPEPGKSTYAVQQPTHSKSYALKDKPFTIPQGTYGATRPGAHVEPKFVSPVEVVEAGNDKIRFLRHEGQQTQEFVGRRLTNSLLGSRPMWALHNATKNRNTADGKKIPNYKPKYQEVAPEAIDLTDEDAVMMPKIDGAHVLVDLPGDPKKFARVYSYRPTGRDTGLIEHTFKFPDFQKKTQVVGKNTMIRAECWGRGKDGKAIPAEQLGGLLNAGVLKSREKQKELGVQLKLTGIDVVRADGKNMENKPFGEKLQVLDRVRKATRGWIDTPEVAVTPDQKKLMLDGIKKRQNPVTDEGVVLRSLSKADAPVKAKFRPDHDVYVTGVFNKPKGKAKGLAGGLEYSFEPGGPTIGRIGTGFDHATRKDMLENPDRYVGRVAKVQSSRTQARKDKSQLRALRAPSFKEWHIDKTNPKLMEEDHRLLKQAATQAPPRGAIMSAPGAMLGTAEELTDPRAVTQTAMRSRPGRALQGWADLAAPGMGAAGGEVQKYLSMMSGRNDNKVDV